MVYARKHNYIYGYIRYVGGKSDKKELTALEKHVSFFDRNKDGTVYPWETYQGTYTIS